MATCFDNLNGKKLVIGLVHLLPMLGTPLYEDGNMDKMTEKAIADCKNEMQIGEEKFSYDAAVIYANDLRATLTIYEVLVSLKEEERNSVNEITFSSNNEKLSAEYTVTTVTKPLPGVVEAAKAEYNRIRAYTADLSDMIEAAALMSRLNPAAEPAFPITANLDYIYEHFEELQGK